jgi:catechol 2,3-dioxygenase-like lactoylglutathione lyase family enzyme
MIRVMAAPPVLVGVLETVLYYDEGREEELERFYRDVLGLRALGRGRWSLSFRSGSGVLLLFERARAATQEWPPPHGATGAVHTCFLAAPDDYLRWKDRLAAERVEIVDEITWEATRLRSVYFRDPAGNMLEIAEGDLWPR